MSELDRRRRLLDLDVDREPDGSLRVPTDSSFWNFTSAFGGWVMAVVVDLLAADSDFRGEVISQQAHFLQPVAGDVVLVSIERLARRSTIDFWRVEVRDVDGELLVTVDLAAGERRATGVGFEQRGCQVAPGDGQLMDVDELRPAWMQHFAQWMVEGQPFTVADRPTTVVRIRPRGDVDFDAAILAMVCDSPMPRTFFASTELVFSSTVALSTHIYASAEDIAGVGADGVVIEADSAVIRNNTLNQEAHVYRSDGLLLATSYQTAVFRSPTAG